MKKRIYLDYAAASPIRKEVLGAITPWLGEKFANPSALYREADEAKAALEESRSKIAKILGVKPSEVVFVASSTEANNLAILGFARGQQKPERILTTPIEHPSILEPLGFLEREGWGVSRLRIKRDGLVNLEELQGAPTNNAKLVTLAWANPDIGVIQPIQEISKLISDETTLHIDASQAGGLLDLKQACEVANLITISSSKIGGPRGIAVLIIKSGTKLEPLIYGGGQEGMIRSGTENVAGAVGFARALELAEKERVKEASRLQKLRDKLLEAVTLQIKDVIITGPDSKKDKVGQFERLPNHASFAFKYLEGEELVAWLNEHGFALGTGSACLSAGQAGATNRLTVSEAVRALKLLPEYERGTLRVTMGKETSEDDINEFLKTLIGIVRELRKLKNL